MAADISSFDLLGQELTDGIDDAAFKQAVAELVQTAMRIHVANEVKWSNVLCR